MSSLLLKPKGAFGAAIIAIVVLLVLLAPWIAPFDPTASGIFFLAQPDSTHWIGTDELGRDILSRLLYGGRSSLVAGIGAAIFATVVGVPIGLLAGYFGGGVDTIVRQFVDLFIALPGLVLALLVTAVLGPTLLNLVIVLGFVSWPRVARLTRGQALAIRETLFVEASRALGGSAVWIMYAHIWPNLTRVVAAQFSLTVAYAIFTSASLSFLGLGVPPPTPDWGGMVRTGFDYLAINPAMSLAPCLAVSSTIFGFYLIGSSIE